MQFNYYLAIFAHSKDAETEDNTKNLAYLMTYNAPERGDQANVSPQVAASQWPDIVSIAREYNLEIVAPCGTIDLGSTWYHKWLDECNDLYSQPC